MAAADWRAALTSHDEPSACPNRVDAQKKSLAASERDEGRRCGFRLQMLQYAASRFVIVDESGYNLNLTPRYARAPRGERAHAKLPRNVPANTTVIAALSSTGMTATMLVSGATDHYVVEAYVEHVLGPSLRPGQVVVLDNLSAHKRADLEPLLARYECQVWFLPPYSPDLSPIELAFAKIKQAVRRAAARTGEALEAAIAQALNLITASDAQGFFAHCGFVCDPPSAQLI
jgi:transposase